MAEGYTFRCTVCEFAVATWSDGNPFYLDENDRKRYAYHPDHENLARCIGNDVPHLCLSCGAETKVDSRRPRTKCRKCKAAALVETWDLQGKTCSRCSKGQFKRDDSSFSIS